jgi:hypothetical protein
LLSRAFSMGIPLTVGFTPQLVVVSGLSVGIPLTVGFRLQLVVVSGLLVGIFLTVGLRLSRSLWLSQSPFTNSSSFTIEFWLSRSLSHELFFHTVEFWLSRSLFTYFSFTRWDLGYHGAFSRIFLSHGGISRCNIL